MQTATKPMNYGHGCCIMVLVGQKMGLDPQLADVARKHLEGGELHPMYGAAMEKESIRMNGLLRYSAEKIAEANKHADALKVEFGFMAPKAAG